MILPMGEADAGLAASTSQAAQTDDPRNSGSQGPTQQGSSISNQPQSALGGDVELVASPEQQRLADHDEGNDVVDDHLPGKTSGARPGMPALERQESTVVGGSTHAKRLPFLPSHKTSMPSAPSRGSDEGVTAATMRSHAHQSSSTTDGTRHSARSASEMSGSASRAKSPSKRQSSTISFGRRAVSENKAPARQKSSRSQKGPLQEAADAVAPPSGEKDEEGHHEDEHGLADKAKGLVTKIKTTRLADLHISRPEISGLSLLPTVHFPGQGSGKESEFLQEAPLWSRMPWKWLYFAYFGLSVGLFYLPYFAVASLFPPWRARASWTWKRSTLVRLYRHGTRLTFRTHTSLSRDISKAVPHSETLRCKFVWIDPTPEEDIKGELRRAMKLQQMQSTRTCGFWYGEPLKGADLAQASAGDAGVGRRAGVNEKVVYHLHGGAYWIGTAHEDDVTAAVNTEVLRYLAQIYDSGESKSTSCNRCTRSLSLDYRLSVPTKPRLGSYPAALLDAVAGYLYLVRHCGFKASNIIVAGDSAGGNLGLALCRYLRDEKIAEVPGSLLLLSPWADVSRSHAGPLSAPNHFSTVWSNRDADIIAPAVAFRNTAVSALIGDLPARETYRNPYLSSCSLQLPPDLGGDGPDWGFEGFPAKTYLCSGSAEISNDQHLTLAHRMAAGTRTRVPIYTGDQISKDQDPYELAARLSYPRPGDHEITLWPSIQSEGSAPNGDVGQLSQEQGASRTEITSAEQRRPGHDDEAGNGRVEAKTDDVNGDASANPSQAQPPVQVKVFVPIESVASAPPPTAPPTPGPEASRRKAQRPAFIPLSSAGAFARAYSRTNVNTPASGPNSVNAILTPSANGPAISLTGSGQSSSTKAASGLTALQPNDQNMDPLPLGTPLRFIGDPQDGHDSSSSHQEEAEGYFSQGGQQDYTPFPRGEDRKVWLDEVKDAVHDFLLFPWHEPERGECWRRIARWIDEA